jgi:hypothetical protein
MYNNDVGKATSSKEWTERCTGPSARYEHAMASVGADIFVFGGAVVKDAGMGRLTSGACRRLTSGVCRAVQVLDHITGVIPWGK